MMARSLGIAPSTFYLWKAQYSEFSECLAQGTELVDEALEATAVQRALGYSYETQKAFQTGVVVTITETLLRARSCAKVRKPTPFLSS